MKGQGWGQTLGLTPVGWFGFIEGLYDVVPNVEMCELEKEMDKDGGVVFRLGWATREG